MKKIRYYLKQLSGEVYFLPRNIAYSITSKKRALYIGCTDKNNLGDEAVFLGINALLKSKIFLYKLSYASPTSGKYLRRLFFHSPEFIILGGGTIILKDKEKAYLRIFNQYHKKYPNAKLVVFGAGVADTNLAKKIGSPTNIEDWREILNQCFFIAVRGPISKFRLKEEWSIEKDVHILHDPSIQFLHKTIRAKTDRKKIGVNFCDILGRIYGLNQVHLEQFAIELVEKLLNDNWTVICIPTTKDDVKYMYKLFKSLNHEHNIKFKDYEDINSTLASLEDVDIFVGQRLHSIIFSTLVGTPFYAIEYESKTSDFVDTIGLKDCIMRTDQLSVETAISKIEYLYLYRDDYQKEQVKLLNQVKKEQAQITAAFFKHLKL